MHDVLILEKNAPYYAARLQAEFPAIVFHAAGTATDALPACATSEVLVALAHEVRDEVVAAMPRLRWISALTSGTEHLASLTHLGADVIVTSGRGIHGPQMSEMAFLYMIALSRDFRGMLANQAERKWERWPQRLLLGKTVVLVGVGAISEEMARRCKAFGMSVIGVSAARSEAAGFDCVLPRSRLRDAAAMADFLIALVPYASDTHHLIDAAVLASMKPSAVFINLARGLVVDEAALIRHLQEERIAGAGLDVYEVEPPLPGNPLWSMPNVIMTPRVGGMSDVYADQVLPLVIHNLRAFWTGRLSEMKNIVRNLQQERQT
jgi:phosphoglycerate dehydrogenase-like enzyme